MRRAIIAILLVAAACGGGSSSASPNDLVAKGDELFHGEATCAICHGADLRGTPMGPPFINEIYGPGHHPDAAFFNAVAKGVQPHHWDFGPMPPLPDVSREDVEAIVAYVRSVQQENGID